MVVGALIYTIYIIVKQKRYVEDAKLDRSFLQASWFVVNDFYRTFMPLTYPPHMLALAAMFIAAGLTTDATTDNNVNINNTVDGGNMNSSETTTTNISSSAVLRDWLVKINVDMEHIMVIVQERLDLYQMLSLYSDDIIPQILERLNRPVV